MADNPLGAWLREERESPAEREGTAEEAGGGSAWWDGEHDAGPAVWDDGGRPPRRRRLLLLAGLPWLVVAVVAVVVLGGRGAGPVPAPRPSARPGDDAPAIGGEAATPLRDLTAEAPGADAAARDASGAATDAPPVPVPRVPPALEGAPPVPVGAGVDPVLGAAAAVAVRNAVTTVDAGTGAARYVDLALPEAVTWVADVAIVRVAAVVLEGAGGEWTGVHAAKYAVPLRPVDGAAVPVAAPWALPVPHVEVEPLDFQPVEDEALVRAVAAALAVRGYGDATPPRLSRAAALEGVLRAETTAVAPGETAARPHALWLSDEPTPALLGDVDPPGLPPVSQASGALATPPPAPSTTAAPAPSTSAPPAAASPPAHPQAVPEATPETAP